MLYSATFSEHKPARAFGRLVGAASPPPIGAGTGDPCRRDYRRPVIIQGLTIKSLAAISGANISYVHAALRCTPEEREQVRRGERPLVLPKDTARPSSAPTVFDWHAVDDDALVEAVRMIGIDRTIDAAVAAEHARA